jgi:hypothetical protein
MKYTVKFLNKHGEWETFIMANDKNVAWGQADWFSKVYKTPTRVFRNRETLLVEMKPVKQK